MFLNQQPNTKKMVQVSEQISTPLQIPIWVGQDCIVMQQQDFRKIEDTRLISYSKLTKEGNLLPIDTNNEATNNFVSLLDNAANNCCAGLTSNGLIPVSTPTATVQTSLPLPFHPQPQQQQAVDSMAQKMDICSSCSPVNFYECVQHSNPEEGSCTGQSKNSNVNTVMVIHRQLIGGPTKYVPQVRVCRGNNTEAVSCSFECIDNTMMTEEQPNARELMKLQKQTKDMWSGC